MITCPEAGFAFMHIPKNGGSSLRDQIQPFDCFGGQFSGWKSHPVLGRFDSAHVPLFWLSRYWPDEYHQVSNLDVFAVSRDPYARFASAMAQRIRQHHKRNPDEMPVADIRADIEKVIDHLSPDREFPDYEFVHFCRQTDFTHLDGQQIALNIYGIGKLPLLIGELGKRLNLNLINDAHVNRTVTFKHGWMKKSLIKAKNFSKSKLPFSVYTRLREAGMTMFTTQGVSNLTSLVNDDRDVRRFIEARFAADFDLYEKS